MSDITVVWRMTDGALVSAFATTGHMPAPDQTTTYAAQDATPEQRAAIAAYTPMLYIDLPNDFPGRTYAAPPTLAELAAICAAGYAEREAERKAQTQQRIADACAHLREKIADRHPYTHYPTVPLHVVDMAAAGEFGLDLTVYAALLAEHRAHRDQWLAEFAAEQEAKAAADRAARDAEQEAKRMREIAKQEWIETHGSAHLKRAFNAGYNCQRLYVTERAGMELPGYEVDFDDNATWRGRACPW